MQFWATLKDGKDASIGQLLALFLPLRKGFQMAKSSVLVRTTSVKRLERHKNIEKGLAALAADIE